MSSFKDELKLDINCSAFEALKEIAPEAHIAGGSFSAWLPNPQIISHEQRVAELLKARAIASEKTIQKLLNNVNVDDVSSALLHNEGGERNWPSGYIGSLTNKGTIVLGAIVADISLEGMGIDLERDDGKDLSSIDGLVGYDSSSSAFGVSKLALFSAKEAVFKAQYRISKQILNFDDVAIEWEKSHGEIFLGKAVCSNGVAGVIKCKEVERWVVSACFISKNVDLRRV